MNKYSGIFYHYRGYGYGSFDTLDDANNDYIKRKLKQDGLYRDDGYFATFSIGSIVVDDKKRLLKQDLITVDYR